MPKIWIKYILKAEFDRLAPKTTKNIEKILFSEQNLMDLPPPPPKISIKFILGAEFGAFAPENVKIIEKVHSFSRIWRICPLSFGFFSSIGAGVVPEVNAGTWEDAPPPSLT